MELKKTERVHLTGKKARAFYDKIYERDAGKEFIDQLPDARGRAILKYYYVDFLTWEQVALRIHLSQSRTYNSHRLALETLNSMIRSAWMQKCIQILKDRSK